MSGERRNVDKLTEDEHAILDYLDEETRRIYDDAILVRQTGFRESRDHAQNLIDVITKLARALTPLKCGHPPGNVIHTELFRVCGWCQAERTRDMLKEKLAEAEAKTETVAEVKAELLRLQEENKALKVVMPCGHPPGCVVSAPSAEGVDTTSHCAWCAAEAQRDNNKAMLAKWLKAYDVAVEDIDALREKLAAATIHLDAKQMRLELARDRLDRETEKLAATKAELAEAYRQLSHEAVG